MLTRKMLKAMGIEEEKIDQIIEAHTETTDALKSERDKFKEEADKVPEVQKKLDEANEKLDAANKEIETLTGAANDDASYKEKYETEHQAFEDFKAEVEANKAKTQKVDAYKALLRKAGVSDKRIDAIVKVTSMDDIELDEKGKIKEEGKVVDSIKSDWSEFIVTETVKGADTETPPTNTGGKMTKEEIMKIKDSNERQKAIEDNHELFGF